MLSEKLTYPPLTSARTDTSPYVRELKKKKKTANSTRLSPNTNLMAVGIHPVRKRCTTELCFSSTTETVPCKYKSKTEKQTHRGLADKIFAEKTHVTKIKPKELEKGRPLPYPHPYLARREGAA